MHTSSLTYSLFVGGIISACLSQLLNFLVPALKRPRPALRAVALTLGLSGIMLASLAAYRASIDWTTLPTSLEGLRPGQLWNNGGVPSIACRDGSPTCVP